MLRCVGIGLMMLVFSACQTKEEEKLSSAEPAISHQPKTVSKLAFDSMEELLADSVSSRWADISDSSVSLILYFTDNDTILAKYSQDCWMNFPFKKENNKIVVLWNNQVQSKVDVDFVMAVYKTDKKYIGQPFMELSLKDDTTLTAQYIHPEMVELINSASLENRTFFPAHFHLISPDLLY